MLFTNREGIFAGKEMIRAKIKEARLMLDDLPSSREASLARTKLEEADMWVEKISEDVYNS